jgi:elongation factor Ts
MAEITAAMVKTLRERTGAGMMECKKALEEAGGDIEKGIEVLRKRGVASAAKKSGRSARQGLIAVALSPDRSAGAVIEFNCESDFVARTDDFQNLVNTLAGQALAAAQGTTRDQLLEQPFAGDASVTVAQAITAQIAKVGENMQLPRFERVEGGVLGSYIHPGAQLGVLVQATGASAALASNEELEELIRDVAMQVAAADPQFISRDQVTPEVLEKEKEIQRARAKAEGKPDAVIEKMIQGRMSKYFEEVCLLEQPFIKDNSVTVSQLLADKSKKLGETIQISRFVRFKVGETSAAEAAEA